jgi:archaellum component FlaC
MGFGDPPGWNFQWDQKMRKIINPLEEEIENLKREVKSLKHRIHLLERERDND